MRHHPRGTVRYVKLEALSEVNGDSWTTAAEFNVLDANGNALNRSGWTITADSQETQRENGAMGVMVERQLRYDMAYTMAGSESASPPFLGGQPG